MNCKLHAKIVICYKSITYKYSGDSTVKFTDKV